MSQENPTLTMIREFVALGRAEFDRPYSIDGDPHAQRKLTEGMAAAGPDGQPTTMSQPLLDLLAPRAPYFDQLVQEAIADGFGQVVNLGAGYDDRGLRFRTPGVRFFDLDLPHVITDKTQRIHQTGGDATNLTMVPADFRTDDVASVLARHGHDDLDSSLFLAEHLALFLDPADVAQLLSALSHRAPSGSRLALTLEVHPAGIDSTEVLSTADRIMFGGTSPLHAIKSREDWIKLLNGVGWTVQDADEITAVDHFQIPIDEHPVQVQTQFVTAIR